MTKKAIVLGCGLVGTTIAEDLAADSAFDVTACDLSESALSRLARRSRLKTLRLDLADVDALRQAIRPFDVVVGALPSRIGFQTLRAVIEEQKPYCDISFMPEDALELDALAKDRGVTAVVDCGVSPGLSNLCVGRAHALLDRAEQAVIYVGGVPRVRRWPYDYKAPFAPADVIEEYTRPARLVEHGRQVEKPALSEPELIDFAHVGTLEACNTDGLRSLLKTVDIRNMKEKTLRYPGHIELMRILRETGFFGKSPIDVGGVRIRPLDLTSHLLFEKWRLDEGEEELTVMRVEVEGMQGGRRRRYRYDLYDEFDRATQTPSMARTTGFPCTIMIRMLMSGMVSNPGVFPPELLAPRDDVWQQMLHELGRRGVELTQTVEQLD